MVKACGETMEQEKTGKKGGEMENLVKMERVHLRRWASSVSGGVGMITFVGLVSGG